MASAETTTSCSSPISASEIVELVLPRSKTGQRGGSERSAARGYAKHPGETHSCLARASGLT